MGLSQNELDPPLDDIAFLARSNNRIAVLEELAREQRTRRQLRDATGVSRATLGRILEGFHDRGWVRSNGAGNGHEYALTPLGRVVVEEFTGTMDVIQTVQQLRDLAPYIPFEELGLDPRDLTDATLTTPSATDSTAHARREVELLEETERMQSLCNQAQPETIERYRDWIVETGGRFEAVITADAIDVAMADEEMRAYLQEMITTEGVTIHRYEGDVSVVISLLDEVASIVPLDESGVGRAFIESEDPTVRSAITETLERYRNRAEPVSLEARTQ